MRLEEALPVYDFSERHAITIAASEERVDQALRAATPGEMPLLRALFGLRSLPARVARRPGIAAARERPLLDQLAGLGFNVLSERPVVLGLVDQPWKATGGETVHLAHAEDFAAFECPGFVKAALDFRCTPVTAGTRLETETRVRATDPATRRRFGRYWRVIRPGSGLVRRSWLRGVKRRAERS